VFQIPKKDIMAANKNVIKNSLSIDFDELEKNLGLGRLTLLQS